MFKLNFIGKNRTEWRMTGDIEEVFNFKTALSQFVLSYVFKVIIKYCESLDWHSN